MQKFLQELLESRLVTSQLVNQYVTLRYRRTVLGFLWTLINPLLTMTITSIIFSLMMRIPIQSFVVFLFAGLIPWTLFSNCILQGGGSIIENETLVKKIYIPKQVFVVSRALSIFIDALLSFFVLSLIVVAIGAKVTSALFFVPIAFIFVFLFSLGLALAMAVLTVYYRDSQYVVGIMLQAGYYLSPIIYPLSIVPQKYHVFFSWNPMFYFIELFRYPIYLGTLPPTNIVCIAGILSAGCMIFGIWIFRKFDSSLIFRL